MSVAPKRSYNQAHTDIKGSAAYLDCSERHIRRLIADGELQAYRIGKRMIRIKVSDLETLARPIPTAS